jgi:hypothetical protein
MIPLLLFLALLLATVSRATIPTLPGVPDATASVLLDVLPRLAPAALAAASFLVVHSIVFGRHYDSR